MKTPRFNYEEMKEIELIRQLQFFYSVAQEQNKTLFDDCKYEVSTEKESDPHELDNPRSGAATVEFKKNSLSQLVEILKGPGSPDRMREYV